MPEVRVEYFAVLREHTGCAAEAVGTTAATAADLFVELDARYRFPRFTSLKVAINDEFCDWNSRIADGDLVVFIPPVAGG